MATEQVQGTVGHVRQRDDQPDRDMILVSYTRRGKDAVARFRVIHGQYAIGDQFPIYFRGDKPPSLK